MGNGGTPGNDPYKVEPFDSRAQWRQLLVIFVIYMVVLGLFIVITALAVRKPSRPAASTKGWQNVSVPGGATSIVETAGGDFLVTGGVRSYNPMRRTGWIMKIGAEGKVRWTRNIDKGLLFCISANPGGGFTVGGADESTGRGVSKGLVIGLDNTGRILWEKHADGFSMVRGVCQTPDGGYIMVGVEGMTGSGRPGYTMLRTDASLRKRWSNGKGAQEFNYVTIDENGNNLAAGASPTGSAVLNVVNRNGKVVLDKRFSGHVTDSAHCVRHTRDGGYVFSGATVDSAGNVSAVLWKADGKGKLLWTKTFKGGAGSSVAESPDGGYVMSGASNPARESWRDAWLIKTDSKGNVLWRKSFGGSGNTAAGCVQVARDGGLVVAGTTSCMGPGQEAWVMKTDTNGNPGKQWYIQTGP